MTKPNEEIPFSEVLPMEEFYWDGTLWTKMPEEFQDAHGGYACVMWDDRMYFYSKMKVKLRRPR